MMRVRTLYATCGFLVLVDAALAQTSPLYANREHRFAVIFPSQPLARDISFPARGGGNLPARQFYVEQGNDRFLVTVVHVPGGPAVDNQLVEHAAEQLRARGEVRFQFDMGYDPGVPGRQLNIFERNGRQLRASLYMWDHRLYIAEASAEPGSSAALQFEQSLTLLDAAGDELDTGQGNAPVRGP
jgi:hypothetical protein